MKFFAPTEHPVYIGLTSGHTVVVNPQPEGTDLDPMFQREAVARGCIPEGVQAAAPIATAGFSRKDAITKALKEMMDGSNPDDFKKDGTPDLRQVSRRVGFQAQRDEVEAAWAEVSKAA